MSAQITSPKLKRLNECLHLLADQFLVDGFHFIDQDTWKRYHKEMIGLNKVTVRKLMRIIAQEQRRLFIHADAQLTRAPQAQAILLELPRKSSTTVIITPLLMASRYSKDVSPGWSAWSSHPPPCPIICDEGVTRIAFQFTDINGISKPFWGTFVDRMRNDPEYRAAIKLPRR